MYRSIKDSSYGSTSKTLQDELYSSISRIIFKEKPTISLVLYPLDQNIVDQHILTIKRDKFYHNLK